MGQKNSCRQVTQAGISATTAREWIGALQASNQILLLEPYHRSLGKRLVKSPKLYFTDTGLAAFLMGLSLLVEWRQTLFAIECKYKERPDMHDLRGIRRLREIYTGANIPGYIACTSSCPFEIGAGVVAMRGWTPWELRPA